MPFFYLKLNPQLDFFLMRSSIFICLTSGSAITIDQLLYTDHRDVEGILEAETCPNCENRIET